MKSQTIENSKATDVYTLLPAVSSRTIFRIEKPEEKGGMWYDHNGVFRKSIHILCPNGIAKDFPMPLNLELHRKDGDIWNSAGKSIENMNEWFTPMDAINLMNNGFKLFQFEVNKFQELENEILFTRNGIIQQKEIPLENVWDIRSVLNGR